MSEEICELCEKPAEMLVRGECRKCWKGEGGTGVAVDNLRQLANEMAARLAGMGVITPGSAFSLTRADESWDAISIAWVMEAMYQTLKADDQARTAIQEAKQ